MESLCRSIHITMFTRNQMQHIGRLATRSSSRVEAAYHLEWRVDMGLAHDACEVWLPQERHDPRLDLPVDARRLRIGSLACRVHHYWFNILKP
jgi:hypothetical protein